MNVTQAIKHSLTLCEGGAAVDVKLKCIVGTNSMCCKCAKRVPTSVIPEYILILVRIQFENTTTRTKIRDELTWTQKCFMFETNSLDTNSRRFLHLIIKRSALTISMNRELLRTISALSWQKLPLDLIQGKYPVIKPSI
jgi:hypothetical protein